MVWPQYDRQQDFDRSSESYRLAAQAVNGLLFPVGDAWREAWKRDATISLYAPDGLHPNAYGSHLAAPVMYRVLYQKSPVGLPARIAPETAPFFNSIKRSRPRYRTPRQVSFLS